MSLLSEDNYLRVQTIGWQVTWCKAFPTLLAWDVYCCDFQKEADDYSVMVQLGMLAYQELGLEEDLSPLEEEENRIRTTSSDDSLCDTQGHHQNWSDCLGYGEISSSTVFSVLKWFNTTTMHDHHHPSATSVYQDDNNTTRKNDHSNDNYPRTPARSFHPKVVCDLGSGSGRVLFALAIIFPFQRLWGMEILPHWHQVALFYYQTKWKRRHPSYYLSIKDERSKNESTFDFQCTDFLLYSETIQQTQDMMIWIHATVFSEQLMMQVQEMCEGCQVGTYFILISRPLKTQKGIQTLDVQRHEMSWGEGMLYIQQKRT